MKLHPTAVALLLTLLPGCGGGQNDLIPPAQVSELRDAADLSAGPQFDQIARDFRSLNLVTKDPVHVDPQLAMLCVGIWQSHLDEARNQTGPHVHTSIRIYMDETAYGAFRRSAKKYPVGSMIVKEKQGLEYKQDAGSRISSKTADGVGGMIKRSPGFDPEHGDWEYFYFQDASKVEQGKISSCIECHRGAADSDYVFGHWAVGD